MWDRLDTDFISNSVSLGINWMAEEWKRGESLGI